MHRKFGCVILLLSFIGCSETEYPHKFPIVLTEEVTDVNSTGARFTGRIQNVDDFKIISYGFVWDQTDDPTLTSSKLAFSNNIKEGTFTQIIQNDLEQGKTYFVRAFIQTDKVVVYGDSKAFNSKGSLPPVINGFAPTEGKFETEITITGKNFSTKQGGNLVTIGGIDFPVVSMSENEIVVKQPITQLTGSFTINVEVAGQTATSTGKYFVIGPIIESVSKTSGRVGDLLILRGQHFDQAEAMFVQFGTPGNGPGADVFFISEHEIACYLPDSPGTSTEKLTLYSFVEEDKIFEYQEPFTIVNSWQQKSPTTPLENYMGYTYAQMGNLVYIIGGRTLYQYNLSTRIWTKKADFPGPYRFNGTSFTFNGKLYYGFGSGVHEPYNGLNGQYFNDLWSFNPDTNAWSSLGNSPLAERLGAVALVINDKVYLGFGGTVSPSVIGFGDLWEYDVAGNSWTQIDTSPLQGNFTYNPLAFRAGTKGYFVGLYDAAYVSVVWEFDPSITGWTRKTDLGDWVTGGMATTMGDHGLVVSNANGPNRTYEYDPVRDAWIIRETLYNGIAPLKFGSFYQGTFHFGGAAVWELSFY